MDKEESYHLGRSEYFNPKNEGLPFDAVKRKWETAGTLPFWLRYFEAGFFAASMIDDTEAISHVKRMISLDTIK